ncbi:MAG: imidazole glycerol phosphate synthase subunit HisH [Verrucomicrobia bacterium]|nr:MAG: imidazole glycerol phosphate synthase subunit HisH [Verrucomicrobiota bacterium]
MGGSIKPDIAVVNYGMGNLRSVSKALEAVGANVRLVTKPDEVSDSAGLVFPGVGALGDCVDALRSSGLDGTIREWIRDDRPFLGVCLGLQALFERSEEGEARGLGVFEGRVVRFRSDSLKVPHMGWNSVSFQSRARPLVGPPDLEGEQFYFVHSYHVVPEDESLIAGETVYGTPFTSMVARGRCFATQFHPEKSQQAGLSLYRGFVTLCSDV